MMIQVDLGTIISHKDQYQGILGSKIDVSVKYSLAIHSPFVSHKLLLLSNQQFFIEAKRILYLKQP